MATDMTRQKRKARKDARRRKRQQKRGAANRLSGPRTGGAGLRARDVASWPILEACINEEWDEEGSLAEVLLARQARDGRVALAFFLVDLSCLGAKDGFLRLLRYPSDYRAERRRIAAARPLVPCDPALAAQVVREGIRYARDLGFEPHPDAREALPLLGDLGASEIEVPVGGPDGRPLYVQGPHDDSREILDHLERRFGADGFEYVVGPGGLPGPPHIEPGESEAGLLLEFAEPLFPADREGLGVTEIEAALVFASFVWNTVVSDQMRGTEEGYRAVRRRFGEKGGGLEASVPSMDLLRERKLKEFHEHRTGFADIEVFLDERGHRCVSLELVDIEPNEPHADCA